MLLTFAKTTTGQDISLLTSFANRHGLIAGATGTGKTVSLQVLAEKLSQAGVPVFMADVKGDLSGLAQKGEPSEKLIKRLTERGIETPQWKESPVVFWDVFGESGHPLRTTISEMGPHLLSRVMNLNETQSSVMHLLFKIADDNGLLLIDMKDLNALLTFVQENKDNFKTDYGHIAPASLGTIQRSLLTLEEKGAKKFFGEPAFTIQELLATDKEGRGYIHLLAADKLLQSPTVYSTFLLWLMSELFENLPEVGDQEKPKLVFFFDEAHLLFKDAPKPLIEKIEQVVRLIRSKGVGIYFVTQSPMDIPDTVLGQLSHRIQHGLRAFTPSDQKSVKVAAQTLRTNPAFDATEVITQLGVGEALVSVLNEQGIPTIVERSYIFPPGSRLGPIEPSLRKQLIQSSPVSGKYEKELDRESAYEQLAKKIPDTESSTTTASGADQGTGVGTEVGKILFGSTGPRGGRKQGLIEKAATSAARSVASSVGREIVRGLLGSLMGKPTRRR